MKEHGTLALVMRPHGAGDVPGPHWKIDANPHIYGRAKRIFGKLGKAQAGNLYLSAGAPETAADLEWFMGRYPLAMSDADRATLRRAAGAHHEMIQRLEDIIDPHYVPRTFAMVEPPRSYQAMEAELLLARGGLLVGDDVGLGKTITGITTLAEPETLPGLVVVQPHLQKQWARQLQHFIPRLTVHILRGGTPYTLPRRDNRGPDVIITTYWKIGGWAKVLAAYCKTVIFDEVQELRHTGTAKYSAAECLIGGARYRLGLSATPIYNYGGEIYNILNLLIPDCLGTHAEFVNEWCKIGMNKTLLKDPKAFGAWTRDQCLIVRHTRKDVKRELPPVTSIPQLIPADQRALDAIEPKAVELAKLILAQTSTSTDRFQASEQLSTLLRQATGISKAPAAADFIRLLVESGESVLVGVWHREVYDILNAKLKDFGPVMYTGTESPTQKDDAVHAFIAKRTPLMFMSLRSGTGVEGLQKACSCAVFVELDWSPYVHKQFIGRVDRDGQDTPVVVYYLMSENGSDPQVAEVLGIKMEQGEGIRNPTETEDFFKNLETDGSRAKALATAYLQKMRAAALVPSPPADELVF